MPLKLNLNHARFPFQFSPFIFGKSIPKRFKRTPSGGVVGFCRIPGRRPISKELPDKGFVFGQGDCEIIEFKHGPTILLSIKRPAFLPALLAKCKQNVFGLFSFSRDQLLLQNSQICYNYYETLTIVSAAINATVHRAFFALITTIIRLSNYVCIRIACDANHARLSTASPSGVT